MKLIEQIRSNLISLYYRHLDLKNRSCVIELTKEQLKEFNEFQNKDYLLAGIIKNTDLDNSSYRFSFESLNTLDPGKIIIKEGIEFKVYNQDSI